MVHVKHAPLASKIREKRVRGAVMASFGFENMTNQAISALFLLLVIDQYSPIDWNLVLKRITFPGSLRMLLAIAQSTMM